MSSVFPHRINVLIAAVVMFCVYLTSHCVAPSGGGSEAGNARITGMVINEQGLPAGNVIVQILPSDYDPVKDAPVADSCIDTTTVDGVFWLGATKGGFFTIQAVQMVSRLRAIIPSIQVITTDDTVADCTLQPPGAVKVQLPVVTDSGRYLYIPGTTFHAYPDDASSLALLDSVPAGIVPAISYSSTYCVEPVVIYHNVTVRSGDTVMLAFQGRTYSKQIVFNTSVSGAGVMTDFIGFPVLVRLTKDNFDFSQANADGGDIRFLRSDSLLLPHEIERWDPVAGRAEIWVAVDTVYGDDSVQSIMLHWGNSPGAYSSSGRAVFDTAVGYQGVWHLGDAAGDSVRDATGNRYHGTSPAAARPMVANGIIGNCRTFNGATDYITMPNTATGKLNFPENGYYSVSAWVFLDTIDKRENAIVAKGGTQYFLMVTYVPSDLPLWDFAEFSETAGWQSYTAPATAGQWTLLTAVCRGGSQLLYSNGMLVDSIPSSYAAGGLSRNTSNDLTIGRFLEMVSSTTNSGSYCFFKGSIDEVRITGTAASPDWVRLCYMNQRSDDRLVVFK